MKQGLVRLLYNLGKVHGVDITHDNVCSSMLSCFYSHLLSTGRPISSYWSQRFVMVNRQEIMGCESVDMVRFDLGTLLQGQMRIAKIENAYNSLIIGDRDLGW